MLRRDDYEGKRKAPDSLGSKRPKAAYCPFRAYGKPQGELIITNYKLRITFFHL
jgi:hypothetical protein